MQTNIGTIFLSVGLAASTSAQGFRWGLKAGVPFTDYFEAGVAPVRGGVVRYAPDTSRFLIGPSTEWRITPTFGLELDALYRRTRFVKDESATVSGVTTRSTIEVTGDSWDFPFLAKYRWTAPVAPFIAGGFATRYMRSGPARGIQTVQTNGTTATAALEGEKNVPIFVPGAALAFGFEFGPSRIRLLPEFRYTRWRTTRIAEPLRLTPHQLEFLLGILF